MTKKKNAMSDDERALFEPLEDVLDDENEISEPDGDVDSDEIDFAVEEHDAAEVDAVIEQMTLEALDAAFMESLTTEDINLGRISIAKVSSQHNCRTGMLTKSLANESWQKNLQQSHLARGTQDML
jgi:hypothetical protein